MFIGKGGKGVSGFYDFFYVFFLSSLQNHYNVQTTELKHYYLLCTYNRRQNILLLK